MGDPKRARRGLGDDWLSVVIGLLVLVVAIATGLAKVPWPLFGWLR